MGDQQQENEATQHSDHLPDETTLQELSNAVRDSYDHAISDEQIFLYETDHTVTAKEHGVHYQIHVLPSLGDKPPPSKDLPDLAHKRDKDPFTPPFVPAEFIGDLSSGSGYHIFLNKFCFLPMQFMLVTAEWKTQEGPLEPPDLFTAWRIVDALRAKGEDVLCFGNIGKRSGASQPHRHLQFIRVPERPGRNGSPTARIPVEELLDNLPEPKEVGEPQLLPGLPYQHYFTPLPTPRPSEETLHALYTAHVAQLPKGITSYNILLTPAGLHLIPRKERDTVIPLPKALQPKPDETDDNDDDEDKTAWKLSTNALGFAGWFFVDPGKDAVLRDFTPSRVLANAGVPLDQPRPAQNGGGEH